MIRRRSPLVLLGVALSLAMSAGAMAAVGPGWPQYLGGPTHNSVSSDTAITPARVSTLAQAWHWTPPLAATGQPAAALYGSPTVSGGLVFIGSNTGVFYALSETTGTRRWSRNLGHVPSLTCGSRGIASTAAVAPDPSRGGASTVYVSSGTGALFALDAATGTVVWKKQITPTSTTVNAYYGWSSPTVVAGHIYLGLSSQCDQPLVRGGVVEVAQSTGTILHRYWSIASGGVGASVWTSAAATTDGAAVFATTGNGDEVAGHSQGDAYAIVKLDGTTMTKLAKWTVPSTGRPADSDFGGSPTLFSASVGGTTTSLVGACNKNGFLYVWRANNLTAGPLWKRQIETPASLTCFAAPIVVGQSLYQPGGPTTIAGTPVKGSVRRMDAATGAVQWETGIGAQGLASAALNSAGVLAVPTFDSSSGASNGVYLVDSQTGAVLRQLGTGKVFSQPVFADGNLFVASVADGLTAYH
jgi:outer membrane protein assembly factor BamB